MSSSAPPLLSREIPALTGLRGLAAFWVLLYHAWANATPRVIEIGSGPYALNLTIAFSGGWTGVDVFFTLSAFLLTLPFAQWQLGLAPRPSLGTYWVRRLVRVFPAYYAQLAVLLLLAGAFGIGMWPDARRLIGNLFLWFNFGSSGVAPINGVAYTLPIEFCFYLVLPLLALLLRPRWWMLLALIAIVETQLYRHLMFDPAAETMSKVLVLEQMPGRLDQFVFGMLAAYAYARLAVAQRLPHRRVSDALFLAGVAGVVLMLVLMQLGFETYWQGSWLLYVWHGATGAAVALMLFAAAAGSGLARVLLANRPLRRLGVISFGVYLWHPPILEWLTTAGAFDRIEGYRLPWSLPLLLLVTVLVAELSYRLVERPMLRLGHRRRGAAAAPGAEPAAATQA